MVVIYTEHLRKEGKALSCPTKAHDCDKNHRPALKNLVNLCEETGKTEKPTALYSTSPGRWKNYEGQILDLIATIGSQAS